MTKDKFPWHFRNTCLHGRRRKGRPNALWLDQVEENFRLLHFKEGGKIRIEENYGAGKDPPKRKLVYF